MRLINVNTYQLEEYFGANTPPYAILSHCWGEGEVSFDDFHGTFWKEKLGGTKIEHACHQARIEALPYLWVDTCCIDKRSSSELSEAINSMYQWYAKSRICYAYLEDVDEDLKEVDGNLNVVGNKRDCPCKVDKQYFSDSRWFTRGWTLQELIAPQKVKFFGSGWNHLGSRRDLSSTISVITKIPHDVLISAHNINMLSVAKKMSWASQRETTRIEDTAYCLLGIFGVNMPLLYGEGDRAFQRLQEELIKETSDQTIFGW
ncbi:HET-domain-containing protein, partial [Acephala macrosclerotiorum]